MTFTYVVVYAVLFTCSLAVNTDSTNVDERNATDTWQSYVLRIPKRARTRSYLRPDSEPQVEWDGWLYDAFQSALQELQFPTEHVNRDCYLQSVKYRNSLANQTLWALKMFDASAKAPVGLLYANSYQMGHFDECISVSVAKDGITGKYCLATVEFGPLKTVYPKFYEPPSKIHVRPDDYSSVWSVLEKTMDPRIRTRNILHWAICMPSSCSASNLQTSLNKILYEQVNKRGVMANVSVHENMCYSPSQRQTYVLGFYIVSGFILFMAALVSVATIVNMFLYRDKEMTIKPLGTAVISFSAYSNIKRLFKKCNRKEFHNIHALKFLTMLGVIAGHQEMYNIGGAVHNGEYVENFVMAPLSILILNGGLIVDAFFLSSGFLTCYYFCQHLEKKTRISISAIIFQKLLRILPLYILVIAFYAYVLPYLGLGPLWNSRVLQESERCQKNWWTNILFINNYINVEDHTWYLSCDMHFFIIGLFIIYISWKWKKMGYALLSAALILSMVFPFYVTYKNNYKGVVQLLHRLLEDPVKMEHFRDAYMPSHMRALPYVIGIILGFVYEALVKSNHKFSKLTKFLLTAVAIASTIGSILSAKIFYIEERPYNRIESSIYAAVHRIPWCLGIGWLIIGDAVVGLGPLFEIFRYKFFVPLGRLTYCAFLIHTIPQLHRLGTLRQPEYFTLYNSIWRLAANVTLTYCYALIFNLFFESPIEKMCRSLVGKISDIKTTTDSQNVSTISQVISRRVVSSQSELQQDTKIEQCMHHV